MRADTYDRTDSSTDITVLRETPALFAWGEIIQFFHVGEYTIAQFQPWRVFASRVAVGEVDRDTHLYHGWVNLQDTARSWASLDAALVGCIAFKNEGPNHRADGYFMRMVIGSV